MFRTGLIEDYQHKDSVSPRELDGLLECGWRHFGKTFFRYNAAVMGGRLHYILPLRIDIGKWTPTRSQRRVLRKNADLRIEIQPASITAEMNSLFLRHAERFTENIPTGLHDFLDPETAETPCQCEEIVAFEGESLVAASFLAIGENAVSSIYGIFDPERSKRSLGIYTMLEEIRFAKELGMEFYYSGYATMAPSHYDYKKGFNGLHAYDWEGNWHPMGTDQPVEKSVADPGGML